MTQGVASELRVARLTVEQVQAMLEAGILRDGDPIELIDGVLVYKDRSAQGEDPMTIGRRHNLVVKLLAQLDARVTTLGCHVQTQGPLVLPPFTELEPDAVILGGAPRDYADRLPGALDAAAVIEVADSSLVHDRTTKLGLYAAAGIRQYVIVNLREDCIEVHEQPMASERRYLTMSTRRAGEVIELLVHEDSRLEVLATSILP